MYPLPDQPTVFDILRRSIVCHSSLFCDALKAAAGAHLQFAQTTSNSRASAIAKGLGLKVAAADALVAASADPDETAAAIIALGADGWISALNLAGRLQCPPQHILSIAAELQTTP